MARVTIYAAVRCEDSPGIARWGAVILCTDEYGTVKTESKGGSRLTTWGRAGLCCVLGALAKVPAECDAVTIYTDCKYISDLVNRGRINQFQLNKHIAITHKAKNRDLLAQLWRHMQCREIYVAWVDDPKRQPEIIDAICVADSVMDLTSDTGYVPRYY